MRETALARLEEALAAEAAEEADGEAGAGAKRSRLGDGAGGSGAALVEADEEEQDEYLPHARARPHKKSITIQLPQRGTRCSQPPTRGERHRGRCPG